MQGTDQDAFAAWVRENAVPLAPTGNDGPVVGMGDDSDLAPLSAMIGDARIVGIGETTHHTHEFLALRARLVRFLVEHAGFDTIVLEVLRPGANAIDDYVTGGAGSAADALIAAGIRMWRNHETAELLEWLRARNMTGSAPTIRVLGADIVAPGNSMRQVLDNIELSAPDAARLRALSTGFDTDPRADQIFYNRLSEEERGLLHATFEGALATLHGSDTTQGRSNTDFHGLVDHARMATQALAAARVGLDGWLKAFPLRDAFWGENMIRLLDAAQPARKFLILASNRHVSASTPMGDPVVPMGAFVRNHFGTQYRVIGGAYGEARFDPPLYGVTYFDGKDGAALDQAIASVATGPLLLDISVDSAPAFVREPQPIRTGLSPMCSCPPAAAFDVIAFVPRLTNAAQLIDSEMDLDYAAVDASRPSQRG